MVKMREEVPEPIKELGARLKSVFTRYGSEEEAEIARRRFEKAVFHGHYTVEEFEEALDEHRHKMREHGEAISDCIKEFQKNWRKAEKLGPHRGKAYRALAKTWFKRIIALEERIDAHLQKFEQKLEVLTAWRQYKIKNDIGAKVDVAEVKQFMAEQFDQFEIDEQSFEEQEADELTDTIRIGPQDTVNESEQEMFNEFIESLGESGSVDTSTDHAQEEDENALYEEIDSDGAAGQGNGIGSDDGGSEENGSSGDEKVDEELEDFLKGLN